MYEALYRYLIKHKKIDLPGIGVLALKIQSAEPEIADHSFLPPQYYFAFEKTERIPSEKLFSWLASNFNITEQEAVIRFNEFLFDLTRQLKEGKQIYWHEIGTLHKEFSGEINFSAEKKSFPWYNDVVAKKVTRENAEHTVLVGEREITSTEMIELLNDNGTRRTDHWWIWPLAIILAILIFLGWYLSENGSGSAIGNKDKPSPTEAPSGYKLSP